MSRTLKLFIDDILYASKKIKRFIGDLTHSEFVHNELIVDAVLRNLEVIGEAATNIPDEVREQYPDIPWRRMVGLRNIVIHVYFDVDLTIIWQIITVNLPSIEDELHQMRNEL